jgi:hypothetical protein
VLPQHLHCPAVAPPAHDDALPAGHAAGPAEPDSHPWAKGAASSTALATIGLATTAAAATAAVVASAAAAAAAAAAADLPTAATLAVDTAPDAASLAFASPASAPWQGIRRP